MCKQQQHSKQCIVEGLICLVLTFLLSADVLIEMVHDPQLHKEHAANLILTTLDGSQQNWGNAGDVCSM